MSASLFFGTISDFCLVDLFPNAATMSETSSGSGCCIKCGHSLPTPTTKFCGECGAPQRETKKCVACGKGMQSQGNFCINCGQDQREPVSSETKSCPKCGQELQLSAPFCGSCGCNQLQAVSQQLCCFCSTPMPESSPSCPVCSAPVDPNIMNTIPLKQCVNPRCQARLMGFVPICYQCHAYQAPPQTPPSSMSASLLAPFMFSLPSSQSKYCATCRMIIPEPSEVCGYCRNSQPLPTPQQLIVVPQPSAAYQAPSFQAPTSQMIAARFPSQVSQSSTAHSQLPPIPMMVQGSESFPTRVSGILVQGSDSSPTSASEISLLAQSQSLSIFQGSKSCSTGIAFGSQSSPRMGEGLVQFQATTQHGTVVTASVHQSTSSEQFSNAFLTTSSTGTALPTPVGTCMFHSATNSNPQSTPEVKDDLKGAVHQTPELASIESGSNRSGVSEDSPMAVDEESILPKDSGVLLSMDSAPTTSVTPALISTGACLTDTVTSGDLQQPESDICLVGAKRLQDQDSTNDPSKRSKPDKNDDKSNSSSVSVAKRTSKRLSSDDKQLSKGGFTHDPSAKRSKIDKEGSSEETSSENKTDVTASSLCSKRDSNNNIIEVPALSSGAVRKEKVKKTMGNSTSDIAFANGDKDKKQENDETLPGLRSLNNLDSTGEPIKKEKTGSQQLPNTTTHPLSDSSDNADQSHQQQTNQPHAVLSHSGSTLQPVKQVCDPKDSQTAVEADSSRDPPSSATQTASGNPQSSPKSHNPSDGTDLFIGEDHSNGSSDEQETSPSTNPPDDKSHEEDGSTVGAVEESNGSSKSALVSGSSPEQVCSSVDHYGLYDSVLLNFAG